MSRSFNGYCFNQEGYYKAPVKLVGPADVFEFCQKHKDMHYEIRIVEPVEDATVVQVINGEYVFPEEWKQFNE